MSHDGRKGFTFSQRGGGRVKRNDIGGGRGGGGLCKSGRKAVKLWSVATKQNDWGRTRTLARLAHCRQRLVSAVYGAPLKRLVDRNCLRFAWERGHDNKRESGLLVGFWGLRSVEQGLGYCTRGEGSTDNEKIHLPSTPMRPFYQLLDPEKLLSLSIHPSIHPSSLSETREHVRFSRDFARDSRIISRVSAGVHCNGGVLMSPINAGSGLCM
ncbi:hypothetical protein QBC36DRAFT_379246 [Triangularia setosa]|uniref:Uncharacterized protein n=1 Tax=Triangularia setosa TaxID=2587417 RepID=A0AAN6W8Q5_9PEZI|nr:hypothetical protein QBC36DRAFT_379246 [Podospora setosa]